MFSDDTEHACMTAQALLTAWDDPRRFAASLAWRLRGWFLSLPPGIGMGTAKACIKLLLGWPAGRSGVFTAGNGPAMRAPIFGACFADQPDRLREMVRASTRLTHTDPKAEEGAWVIAMAAAHAVTTPLATMIDSEAFFDAVLPSLQGEQLKKLLTLARDCLRMNETAAEFAKAAGLDKGVSGYINHTVPAVVFCWLRHRGDFRRTVEQTILLGGDADTTGAIVGGLAGASTGTHAYDGGSTNGDAGEIPDEWVRGLWEWPRSVNWINQLAERLAERFEEQRAKRRIDQSPTTNSSPSRHIRPPRLFWPGILPRNLLLLLIVLIHGLRRLFPPY